MTSQIYHQFLLVHPLVPWVLLSLAIWLGVYAVRRFLPSAWLWLEKLVPPSIGKPASNILLALPAVAFGAVFAAFTTGETSLPLAFWGAVSGAVAPILHHALKVSPLPYSGPVRDAIWVQAKKAAKRLFPGAFLLLVGCFPRPAGRDACYARADADAFAAYVRECEGYSSTRDCPAANDIEERHRVTQEACP